MVLAYYRVFQSPDVVQSWVTTLVMAALPQISHIKQYHRYPILRRLLIVVGDYDSNLLNNEIHTETGNFFNVLFSNSIIPLITRPTLIHIISNKVIRSDCKYLSSIILEDISDHQPVFLLLEMLCLKKNNSV